MLLFALTVISFVPRPPTIEAQAPSLQGQNDPAVAIEFNTWNSKEEFGTPIHAQLTFTNFQNITCDKNDGGEHHTAFDDPCYFQVEVHQRPPETGRVSQCEGTGIGGPRSFSKGTGVRKVIRFGLVSTPTDCPVGLYMLKVKLKESNKTVVATATANFEIIPAQPTNTPAPTATPTYTAIPPTATPTVDGGGQNSPQEDPTAIPTPTVTPTEMPPPSVRIDGLPSSFDEGQQTGFNMIFEDLDDSDQYGYRADVIKSEDSSAADECEGTGLGGNSQFTAQLTGAVNGLKTVSGVIDASCPPGSYSVSVTLMANSGFGVTATHAFQVLESAPSIVEPDTPTPTPTPADTPTKTATETPTPTEMPSPNARIEELPSNFDEGQQTNFKMVFENLDDSDQYGYRADVTKMDDDSAADDCEGTGPGGNSQYTAHLSGMVKNQVSVTGEIDSSCPASKYSVSVVLMDSGGQSYSANQEFQVVGVDEPTPTPTPTLTATPMPPPSVQIDGLPSAFDQGQQTSFNMIFEGIDDSDEYNYRADVTNADSNAVDDCEGTGVGGANQYTAGLTGAVNGQITVPGLIDASCPSDTYTLTVMLMADGGFTYTATQAFQVNALSQSPIATDTPTPTATATSRPRQQQPPQQQPAATNTPVPTATAAPAPTPTAKVSYSPPPQQKQPAATATPLPTATATARTTQTPTVTPTDDLTGEFPDRIISVDDDNDVDAGDEAVDDAGADTGTTTAAPQTASASADTGSGWPGHYAAGRSVWDCRDLSALTDSLAALRSTMTAGSYPQAVTQPEIMNARLGPGLAYDVITTLPQGTRANIIGVDPRGEWYQLELSHLDFPVWIYQGLASVEGSLESVREVPAADLAELPISGAPGSRPIAFIVPEVMNVRLGPGFDYEVLTTLPQGKQVEVVGIVSSSEWLQVELEGMPSLGWLYRELVVVDCPLVNVRRITEREIVQVPAAITQPSALYAYSGPGLAYARVAILSRGTWAQIIAIGDCPPNVWYQIIVPGLDEPVWVVRDFVKVAVGSLAGLPRYGVNDFTPPAPDERPIAVIQSDTLNVRTGPGLEYAVVAEVPQGTQIRIYGTDPSESWLLVEIDGYNSLLWVYRPMTQVKSSLVGVRLVTAAEITAQPAALIQPQAVFGRSGPGTEFRAVTILPKGTWAKVVGIGPRSEWVLVHVAGMDEPVWVLCDLAKIIGSLTGVPQLSP